MGANVDLLFDSSHVVVVKKLRMETFGQDEVARDAVQSGTCPSHLVFRVR